LLTDELRELYQEVILDHQRSPRNFRVLPDANHTAEGHNPLCGDQIIVYLNLQDDIVTDIGFRGDGCAISKASASIMTELLKGKTRQQAERLFRNFQDLVTGKTDPAEADPELEQLVAFAGVRQFPLRVKCATLAWHALCAALEDDEALVSTE